jgi:hypothetical protein
MGYLPPNPKYFMDVSEKEITEQIRELQTAINRKSVIMFIIVTTPFFSLFFLNI